MLCVTFTLREFPHLLRKNPQHPAFGAWPPLGQPGCDRAADGFFAQCYKPTRPRHQRPTRSSGRYDGSLHTSFSIESKRKPTPMKWLMHQSPPTWVPVVQTRHVIKEKAFRLGIRTGCTPDFNLIWEHQRLQGFMTCFGAPSEHCDRICRWYDQCHRLSLEPLDTPFPMPAVNCPATSCVEKG